jgi:hypothetical protein
MGIVSAEAVLVLLVIWNSSLVSAVHLMVIIFDLVYADSDSDSSSGSESEAEEAQGGGAVAKTVTGDNV